MIARIVAIWLFVTVLTGSTIAATPNADPHGLAQVAHMMRIPGVTVSYTWETCGTPNAYYQIRSQRVRMCKELETILDSGAIRFILAHELAHAIIRQKHIAYTGSEEVAADELAAFVLSVFDHQADIISVAEWFEEKAQPENPYDEHSGDLRRAYDLQCIALGSTGDGAGYCNGVWNRVQSSWLRLLGL